MILNISSDAISRVVNIGRDDAVLLYYFLVLMHKRTLPLRIKDIFLVLLHFISDSVLIPWAKACSFLLSKHANQRSQSSINPPSNEFITSLASLGTGKNL